MDIRILKFISNRNTAVTWTLIILILMTIPGTMLPNEEKTWIPNLDKLVHASLFGGFVVVWSAYYASKPDNPFLNRQILSAFIIGSLYGIVTELLQKYVIPNRDFDMVDIAADITGAVIAYFAARRWLPKYFPR